MLLLSRFWHVSIARSEYLRWPPRDVRRGALHTFCASSLTQIVRSPRWRRLSLYSAQLITRYCALSNLCRRDALNLCGI